MMEYGIQTLVLLFLFTGCFCQNQTAPAKTLHKFLFQDYNKDLRPVYNVSTPTPVIMRMVLRNLISLDTRAQVFTVDAWLKFTWRDEFLSWDPADFDGLDKLVVPVDSIWSPDITLHHNADFEFERYKPDTVAEIHQDGTVIWFVTAIYTTICKIRVKWFPFDVQVCHMVFSSWGYNGFEIDLSPEDTLDALTIRYITNGIWDIKDFHAKQEVVRYLCCPEPYPEVHYTMVFKRHPTFYIYYMILPCVLLAILSLLVFYLPSDCGEKLTLSITNLLALVVFQQLIAANMPPSADSPIIGNYFLALIIMVCVSVIATGIVMHLSSISQPVPPWVQRVFLDVLPRILCLNIKASDASLSPRYTVEISKAKYAYNQDVELEDDAAVVHANGESRKEKSISNELRDAIDALHFIRKDIAEKNTGELQHLQWRQVSMVCDRVLLVLFTLFMLACTMYMALEIFLGSELESDNIKRELEAHSGTKLN